MEHYGVHWRGSRDSKGSVCWRQSCEAFVKATCEKWGLPFILSQQGKGKGMGLFKLEEDNKGVNFLQLSTELFVLARLALLRDCGREQNSLQHTA